MAANLPLYYSTSHLSLPTGKIRSMSVKAQKHKANGLTAREPPPHVIQTASLCYDVTMFVLKEEGFRMNGYTLGNGSSEARQQDRPCLAEASFVTARETLQKGCVRLREQHGAKMVAMVKTLGISDSELCESFHKVCATIVEEEINWGRITSLFTFAGLLAARLLREGQPRDRVYSLIQWEAEFINDKLSPWVQRHGGWAGVNNALSLDRVPVERSRQSAEANGGGGWLTTVAAIGLGALVVGLVGGAR